MFFKSRLADAKTFPLPLPTSRCFRRVSPARVSRGHTIQYLVLCAWQQQRVSGALVYDIAMAENYVQSGGGGGGGDDDARLETDRARNDQKLKSRFEHIFRKYEHDFTGVGDEIEIHTNTIVVNNGHLEHMRSEVDPGRSASSRFLLKTFQHPLEHGSEDASTSSDDEEDSGDSDESDEDGEDNNGGDNMNEPAGVSANPLTSANSHSQHDSLRALDCIKRPVRLPRLTRLLVEDGTPQSPIAIEGDAAKAMVEESPHRSVSEAVTPAAVLAEALTQSTAALHASDGRRAGIDSDTIQALGTSIADRLAQLMGSSKKASKRAKVQTQSSAADPVWDYPQLPRAPKEKRKRSPSPALPTTCSPLNPSVGDKSLWSGVADPAAARKRRRRNLYAEVVQPPVRRFGVNTDAVEQKRCWNCSLTRSHKWIQGPHGQDLCVSCGQYYQHHGRMKPFDSPTPPPPDTMESDTQVKEENKEPTMLAKQTIAVEDTQLGAERQRAEIQLEPKTSASRRRDPPPSSIPCSSSSVLYTANTSRPMTRPQLPKQVRLRWTAEENARMIKLKEADNLSWEEISEHFPNRSAGSVQVHYSSNLKGQRSEGRDLFDQGMAMERDTAEEAAIQESAAQESAAKSPGTESSQIEGWSEQHDALLLELIEDEGLGWREVASLLPGDDVEAVKRRYEVITEDGYEQSTTNAVSDRAPSPPLEILQSPSRFYTPEEDDLISRLVGQGLSWYDMAKHFHGRAPGSLHKRYSTKLKVSHSRTRRSLPTASLTGLQRCATPLLRQALDNSLRRQSDSLVQYQSETEPDGTEATATMDHELDSGMLQLTPTLHPADSSEHQSSTSQPEYPEPSQQLEEELLRSSTYPPDRPSAVHVAPSITEDDTGQSPTPDSRAEHASEEFSVPLHSCDSDTSVDNVVPVKEAKLVDLAIRSCRPSASIAVGENSSAETLYAGSSSPDAVADSRDAADQEAAADSSTDGVNLAPRPARAIVSSDANSMVARVQSHTESGALVPVHRLDEGLETATLISDFTTALQYESFTTLNSEQIDVETHSPNDDAPSTSDFSHQAPQRRGCLKGKKRSSKAMSATGIETSMQLEDQLTRSEEEPGSIALTTESATWSLQAEEGVEAFVDDMPRKEVAASADDTTSLYRPRSRHVTFNPEVIVTTPIETNKPRLTKIHKTRTPDLQGRSKPAGKRRSVRLSINSLDAADLANDPLSSPRTVEAFIDRTGSHLGSEPIAHVSSSSLFAKPSWPASDYKTPKSLGLRRLAELKSHSTPRRRSTPIIDHKRGNVSRRVVETAVRTMSDPEEDDRDSIACQQLVTTDIGFASPNDRTLAQLTRQSTRIDNSATDENSLNHMQVHCAVLIIGAGLQAASPEFKQGGPRCKNEIGPTAGLDTKLSSTKIARLFYLFNDGSRESASSKCNMTLSASIQEFPPHACGSANVVYQSCIPVPTAARTSTSLADIGQTMATL
ncbi:uncharacterized protein MYCFIDRAFT_178116 [Pseudocercospora fijiensis CIRAD86]|uniref:GATA-type domain-containing protein n=1 Tax=Pseudocercospora fijiensis (strain CIRAD86) TaxID=383855 RepID=M2YP39_PSEFD|nr:uncharacterized protein MYCFIDRAFT_178116 [Pseudocercospora fijiensis CIRAD86]EME79525.1 hypothetical protein MYCFIDRAFT_178116 [Pseudocercospora fijiensis CIRAD86]